MTSTLRDRLVAAALIVMGAAAIWSGTEMGQGAGVFPVAMGMLVILAAAAQAASAKLVSAEEPPPEKVSWPRFLIAVVLAVGFFLTIEPLGTYIAIPLYLFAAFALLSRLPILVALAVGAGFSAAIFVVFEFLLEVPTPPGLLDYLLDR